MVVSWIADDVVVLVVGGGAVSGVEEKLFRCVGVPEAKDPEMAPTRDQRNCITWPHASPCNS